MKFLMRTPVLLIACGLFCSGALYAACKVPSADTEFCLDLSPNQVGGCDEPAACSDAMVARLDRQQFPKRSDDAASGTTKESRENCWRASTCALDGDTGLCAVVYAQPEQWFKGDKIVEDTRTCPTE